MILGGAVVGVLVLAVWFLLVGSPKHYLHALFATAPWIGVYVTVWWEVDAFKCGLLLLPLVLVRKWRPERFGKLLTFYVLVLGYAATLIAWQIGSGELSEFYSQSTLGFHSRLLVQNGLFVLRLLLPLAVISQARSLADVEGWANTYVWSVTVLASYGLVQEASFLLMGSPITPIWRDGILGSQSEFVTVSLLDTTWLRVHSFSREPKDLALFCVPAMAWLWTRLGLTSDGPTKRSRGDAWRLILIIMAALLTFSSSLLLCLPLVFLGVEAIRPRGLARRDWRYWAKVTPLLLAALPLFIVVSGNRTVARFTNQDGGIQYTRLLQENRERPAIQFLTEHWPRSALGYGIGMQAFYLSAYLPREESKKVVDLGAAVGVDSMFLGLFADLGIPGLVLILCSFAWVLARKKRSNLELWPVRAGLLATVIMAVPLNPDQRGVIWLFVGLTCTAGLFHVGASKTVTQEVDQDTVILGWLR